MLLQPNKTCLKLDLPKSPMCISAFTYKKSFVVSVRAVDCSSCTFWSLKLTEIIFSTHNTMSVLSLHSLSAKMFAGITDYGPRLPMYPTRMHPTSPSSLGSAVKTRCHYSHPLKLLSELPSLRARAVCSI